MKKIFFLCLMLLTAFMADVSAQKSKKQNDEVKGFLMDFMETINKSPDQIKRFFIGKVLESDPWIKDPNSLNYLAKNMQPSNVQIIDLEQTMVTLPGQAKVVVWCREFAVPNADRSPVDLLKMGDKSDALMIAKAAGIDRDKLDQYSALPIVMIRKGIRIPVGSGKQ
ncbi:MAG: hypothetical protein AAF598_21990 [Bacteroidota bacterium]